MSRSLVVAAAQMGPIPKTQPRQEVVARLIAMMETAKRMGADIVVYTEAALTAFNKAVLTVPEVEQCHMMASSFDYLLKVRTSDIQSYRRVLGEVISALPHVASTSTYVAMEAVKEVF